MCDVTPQKEACYKITTRLLILHADVFQKIVANRHCLQLAFAPVLLGKKADSGTFLSSFLWITHCSALM